MRDGFNAHGEIDNSLKVTAGIVFGVSTNLRRQRRGRFATPPRRQLHKLVWSDPYVTPPAVVDALFALLATVRFDMESVTYRQWAERDLSAGARL